MENKYLDLAIMYTYFNTCTLCNYTHIYIQAHFCLSSKINQEKRIQLTTPKPQTWEMTDWKL